MLEEFDTRLQRSFSAVKADMTELVSSLEQQLRHLELISKDVELVKTKCVSKKEFNKEIKDAKKQLRAVDYADDISELRGDLSSLEKDAKGFAAKKQLDLVVKEHSTLVNDINARLKVINKQFEQFSSLKQSLAVKEKEFNKGLKTIKSVDTRLAKIEKLLNSFVKLNDFQELAKKVATEEQLKALVEDVNSNFKVMAKEI
jgi:hypothetical protein